MPFKMDFTDPTGTDHPNSHWRTMVHNLAFAGGNATDGASLTFYGYHDLASWKAGKQPIQDASKSYSIPPAVFASIYRRLVPVARVTNKALASNVATLTTAQPHNFLPGDKPTIAAVDSTFNGRQTLTAVTSTTLSYPCTAADVASQAATGLILPTVAEALRIAVYRYIMTVLDTPDPNNPGNLIAFFANAVTDPEI